MRDSIQTHEHMQRKRCRNYHCTYNSNDPPFSIHRYKRYSANRTSELIDAIVAVAYLFSQNIRLISKLYIY